MNTTLTTPPPEANTAPDKDGKGVVSAATCSPSVGYAWEYENEHWSDAGVTCAKCGSECSWERCNECCGDGCIDAHEYDPVMFAPGETKRCPDCNGKEGSYWCENSHCEVGEIALVLPKLSEENIETHTTPKRRV